MLFVFEHVLLFVFETIPFVPVWVCAKNMQNNICFVFALVFSRNNEKVHHDLGHAGLVLLFFGSFLNLSFDR